MNQVTLLGRLTRDPEVRFTQSQKAICKIGLAVSKKYRTGGGEMKEEVAFIDCEAWEKTAENIGKFFSKGSRILLTGELRMDEWEDKNGGGKRSKLLVRVNSFDFIDSKNDAQAPSPVSRPSAPAAYATPMEPEPIDPSTIPF